jgi:hypothetical protein
MKYCIGDLKICRDYGFRDDFHSVNEKKGKMVLNENELRRVDEDIEKAAKIVGGEILTLSQLEDKVKEWNDGNS